MPTYKIMDTILSTLFPP